MQKIISELYDFLGFGNTLTILTFFIETLLTIYFYFKTFFRLVYSQQKICKSCQTIKNWKSNETEFETRIIFYNNGRKSLNKEVAKKLEIKSTEEILECEQLSAERNLNIKQGKKLVKINFDYLDASEFFLLSIKHRGTLLIEGRIAETGKLLQTETKSWLVINIFVLLVCSTLFFITTGYNNSLKDLISLIFLILIYFLTRFIHSLFFIPDSLTAKYLSTTDKLDKEFKNKF